jgi:hypothetical protein
MIPSLYYYVPSGFSGYPTTFDHTYTLRHLSVPVAMGVASFVSVRVDV